MLLLGLIAFEIKSGISYNTKLNYFKSFLFVNSILLYSRNNNDSFKENILD